MTDEQYELLLKEVREVKNEASHKGHFWLLILVIAIAVKTQACS
jgi:hypothetical protein